MNLKQTAREPKKALIYQEFGFHALSIMCFFVLSVISGVQTSSNYISSNPAAFFPHNF